MIQTIKTEVGILWKISRRDLQIGLFPFPIFSLASAAQQYSSAWEILRVFCISSLYGYLYLHSFELSNQLVGIEEDKISKPDRVLATNAISIRSAWLRYVVSTALYLGLALCLDDVFWWAALWVAVSIAYNFLNLSGWGPTKDICMGFGAISMLTPAWIIGGAPITQTVWAWIVSVSIMVLLTASIQDFRDLDGDSKVGRRTTPMILGDTLGRVYVALGMVSCTFWMMHNLVLDKGTDIASATCVLAVIMWEIFVLFRLFAFRSAEDDAVTYKHFGSRYLLCLVVAGITLNRT